MTTVNIYLNFDGNCESAFNFYKSVFGGEFPYVGRFKDIPAQEGMPAMKESDLNKIMHICLPISAETKLMGSDTGGEWAPPIQQGNNFSVSVNTTSKSEADRIHAALSVGGKVTMPMNQTFWGSYFGMCFDQFGIQWMVSYDEPKNK